jgi:hypothetical protein
MAIGQEGHDESSSGKIRRRPAAPERANEPRTGVEIEERGRGGLSAGAVRQRLTFDEAARRIDVLKAEIELADQF